MAITVKTSLGRRKAKKARRGKRKGRGRNRTSTGGMLKQYKYKFALQSQVLLASQSAANSVSWALAPAGTVPFKNTPGVNIGVTSGSSSFANICDVSLSCTNQLTDVQNIGTFTTMYDSYKITKVHCEVEYLSNVAANNTVGLMPTIYYWVDRDDAVVPSGLAQILGKQGVRKWHPTSSNSSKTISYTPAYKVGTVNSNPPSGTGITPGALMSKPMWLDCTQGMVPGYALKMVIVDFFAPGVSGVNNAFRFNWHYEVAFRAPLICT